MSCDIFDIEGFIRLIKDFDGYNINKGFIIDAISENKNDWALFIKVLVIYNTGKSIPKDYLMKSLNHCYNERFNHFDVFIQKIVSLLKDSIRREENRQRNQCNSIEGI